MAQKRIVKWRGDIEYARKTLYEKQCVARAREAGMRGFEIHLDIPRLADYFFEQGLGAPQ